MKTRDELAEALYVASVGDDTVGGKIMEATAAFEFADAFVAERERRAVVVPTDSAPVVKCKHCEQPALHRDRADRTGWLSPPCCGGGACCIASKPGHSRAPLPDAPAETAALKFSDVGDMLDADGEIAMWRDHGADAGVWDGMAMVRIAARDRDHAERIVAAMLPVGRETK